MDTGTTSEKMAVPTFCNDKDFGRAASARDKQFTSGLKMS
jgi:hypothetical protein